MGCDIGGWPARVVEPPPQHPAVTIHDTIKETTGAENVFPRSLGWVEHSHKVLVLNAPNIFYF